MQKTLETKIASEILIMSWYEHSKKLNELSRIYGPEHPERINVSEAIEKIVTKRQELGVDVNIT